MAVRRPWVCPHALHCTAVLAASRSALHASPSCSPSNTRSRLALSHWLPAGCAQATPNPANNSKKLYIIAGAAGGGALLILLLAVALLLLRRARAAGSSRSGLPPHSRSDLSGAPLTAGFFDSSLDCAEITYATPGGGVTMSVPSSVASMHSSTHPGAASAHSTMGMGMLPGHASVLSGHSALPGRLLPGHASVLSGHSTAPVGMLPEHAVLSGHSAAVMPPMQMPAVQQQRPVAKLPGTSYEPTCSSQRNGEEDLMSART